MSTPMTTDAEHDELVPLYDGPVGSVFAGILSSNGAAYALKVYPGSLRPDIRAELEAELAALNGLRGKAPVLLADLVHDLPDGRCAVRMELCAQSLPELVASFGPLTVADTLVLGVALADALADAHRLGVAHGGVTPGNVLFRPSGEPVLSDFGIALRKAFPRDANSDVEYLAPETVREGTADGWTDLYGLGAVLYLALTGSSPFPGPLGEHPQRRRERVLDAPAPTLRRPDLPVGLVDLVAELLAKDPADRGLDAAQISARLTGMRGVDAVPLPDPAAALPQPAALPEVVDGPLEDPGFFDLSAVEDDAPGGQDGAEVLAEVSEVDDETGLAAVQVTAHQPAERALPGVPVVVSDGLAAEAMAAMAPAELDGDGPDEDLDGFDDDLEDEVDAAPATPFIPPPPMHWPPAPPEPAPAVPPGPGAPPAASRPGPPMPARPMPAQPAAAQPAPVQPAQGQPAQGQPAPAHPMPLRQPPPAPQPIAQQTPPTPGQPAARPPGPGQPQPPAAQPPPPVRPPAAPHPVTHPAPWYRNQAHSPPQHPAQPRQHPSQQPPAQYPEASQTQRLTPQDLQRAMRRQPAAPQQAPPVSAAQQVQQATTEPAVQRQPAAAAPQAQPEQQTQQTQRTQQTQQAQQVQQATTEPAVRRQPQAQPARPGQPEQQTQQVQRAQQAQTEPAVRWQPEGKTQETVPAHRQNGQPQQPPHAPATQPVPAQPPVAKLPQAQPFPNPAGHSPGGNPPGVPAGAGQSPSAGLGEPILAYGPEKPGGKRVNRNTVLLVGGGVLLVVVVFLAVQLLNRPDTLSVPPAPAKIGAPTTQLPGPQGPRPLLAAPIDQGEFVKLSWSSSEKHDFVVIVAAEGQPAKALLAHRETTLRVEVDPVAKYCFLVQGSDGNNVYESDPRGIRGASCAKK